MSHFDRRGFLRTTGLAGLALAPAQAAQPLTEKEKLDRIASNTWPIRYIFKSRTGFGPTPRTAEMKKKYGEITMLDFPQFTKETFPGVYHMDLFSGLFGDMADDSMYVQVPVIVGAATRVTRNSILPARPANGGWRRWRTRWRRPEPNAITFRITRRAISANWMPRNAKPASRWRRNGWTAPQCWARNPCA